VQVHDGCSLDVQHLRDGPVVQRDELARTDEKSFAGRCERHAARGPHEQRYAQLALQLCDLATKRLLGDEHSRRGAGEVQLFGHGHEIPQRPHVELRTWGRAIHASRMLVADEEVLELPPRQSNSGRR
jgi:hypothetical protein